MIVTDHQPNHISVTVYGEFSLADYKEFEDLVNFKVKFEGRSTSFDLRQMGDFTLDVAWDSRVPTPTTSTASPSSPIANAG